MTNLTPGIEADTSNYRKHTNGNPVQRRMIDRFHRVILSRVAEEAPSTFLDAGCGEGFVTELLADRFPSLEIEGFDANPGSVAVARNRVPSARFVEASIYDIPFEANAFDVVGCFEVLEHMDDPTAALRELHRVSGRTLILSVPHEPYFCLANLSRGKNLDVRPRGSDPDHRQFWSRRAFAQFVEQVADVQWLGGSLPWSICVARKRGAP